MGPEHSSARDVIIVNEEKKPMLLTLWNAFDEIEGKALAAMIQSPPLIFGMRLKVTTFNCLSLTTRSSSGFMINPPAAVVSHMKNWYNTNKDELREMVENKNFLNSDMLLPPPKQDEIISISRLTSSLHSLKSAWIKGKAVLSPQQKSFWFTACSNCHKALEADLEWIVTCPSCKQQSEVEARIRMTVVIDDGTTSIPVTMFTPDADKLLPHSALEIKQLDEHGTILQADIAKCVGEHTILAFVCTFEIGTSRQNEIKISVVKAYTMQEFMSKNEVLPLLQPTQDLEMSTGVDSQVTIPKGKEQLFSPTAKVILEEIAAKSVRSTRASSAHKITKRSLEFCEGSPDTETVPEEHQRMENVNKPVKASPSKKNKEHIA